MRFHRSALNSMGAVISLHDYVGFLQSFFYVPYSSGVMSRPVRLRILAYRKRIHGNIPVLNKNCSGLFCSTIFPCIFSG